MDIGGERERGLPSAVDKKRIFGIRDFNTNEDSGVASITRNNRRRRCRSDPRRRHFSRVFAPFLPEKLPTRAESRNLIPGEGGSSFLSLARCCFTAVFADIYCRVRVEGRRRDATTAKAADCGCFLFPLLLSICDFSSLSLRRTIEFELRFAAVPLSRTISWRRRASAIAITAGRKFQLTHYLHSSHKY